MTESRVWKDVAYKNNLVKEQEEFLYQIPQFV